ncbi:MAG: hypothetical protein CMJ42_08080 [Phyllobacteriaceae bacterium]|nr:hypothetical protein [Phyllobacteriaceae bacterium]MBA89726.1 hypothetical protein [Phyllobacteriaceae bacterium]
MSEDKPKDGGGANVVPLAVKRMVKASRNPSRVLSGAAPDRESVLHDPDIDDGDIIDRMNDEFAFVVIGGSAAVAWFEPGARPEDSLRLLKIGAFEGLMGHRWTTYDGADGKPKTVTWAKRWLGHPERATYRGLEFVPSPTGEEGRAGWLNLWRGFAVEPKAGGSWAIFRDHLLSNVCQGNEAHFRWLFGWFAQMVQRPRDKPGTAVILRGGQGVGKSIVGEVFGSLLGPHWKLVDTDRGVTGNFNQHLSDCLLLQADEAVWAGNKDAEGRLKGLVTAGRQMVEAKGIDPVWLPNLVRVFMTSNSDYVAPAGKDERRYFVLDVGDSAQRNSAYFGEMLEELDAGGREALLHDLLTFDLSAVDIRETPKTEALREQKIHHLDPLETWLLDRLKAGAPTRKHDGWPELVPCDDLYDDYLTASERAGFRRKLGQTAFGRKLKAFIPGLTRQRASVAQGDAMKRPYVYWLPSLQQCRDEFDAALQQPGDWDSPDD